VGQNKTRPILKQTVGSVIEWLGGLRRSTTALLAVGYVHALK